MLWILWTKLYEYRICTKYKQRPVIEKYKERERERKIEIGWAFRKKDILHGNKYCPYLRFHLLIVHCLLWYFFLKIFIYTFIELKTIIIKG